VHDTASAGVAELRSAPRRLPDQPGVYWVSVSDGFKPVFMADSPASWHKGRCPTVTVEVLESKWVGSARTIYVGKASGSLRERVGALVRFGVGGRQTSIGHWGGRYIWQIADSEKLEIFWEVDPKDPECNERRRVVNFNATYGAIPFANHSFPAGCRDHRG